MTDTQTTNTQTTNTETTNTAANRKRVDLRAVFAHTLLTGSPTHLSQRDETSLQVEFATIGDLRQWLAVTGLDTPDLLTGEHRWTGEDGRQVHMVHAYPEDWHGWTVYANATEYTDTPLLAPDLRARLTAATGPRTDRADTR